MKSIPYSLCTLILFSIFLAKNALSLRITVASGKIRFLQSTNINKRTAPLQVHTQNEPISSAKSSLKDLKSISIGLSAIISSYVLQSSVSVAREVVTKGKTPIATNEFSYLNEPTPEFKEEAAKVAAFNSVQSKIRKDWDAIVARIESSEAPSDIEKALIDAKNYLKKIQDLPVGVKKRDFVKLCRAKKFITGRKVKPNWTTEVEIAYESLIQEINSRLTPQNAAETRL